MKNRQQEFIEFPEIKHSSAYSLEIVRKPIPGYKVSSGKTPEEIAEYLFSLGLAESPQEHFVVLHLNIKNLIVGHTIVSKGLLDRSHFHCREVFQAAIINGGTAKIIIAHNHPSGDITPSAQDITSTKNLTEVGELLSIPVIDHLIVGYDIRQEKRIFLSFRGAGLFPSELKDIA